jgi:hypothetical protein
LECPKAWLRDFCSDSQCLAARFGSARRTEKDRLSLGIYQLNSKPSHNRNLPLVASQLAASYIDKMVASQISTRTVHPPVGKQWHKGQSGNPGGRPKVAADVKEEARKHTKEALDRLVHWMRSDDPQASIRAAMALLDRGCGKPTQAVEGKPTEDCVVRWMTADEANARGLDPGEVGAKIHPLV